MLAELGYFSQEKLEDIKLPFGLTIERDLYIPKDIKLRDAIRSDGLEVPSNLLSKKSKEREER